jgi:hypothetical protein
VSPHVPVVRSGPLLLFIFILFLNATWYKFWFATPYDHGNFLFQRRDVGSRKVQTKQGTELYKGLGIYGIKGEKFPMICSLVSCQKVWQGISSDFSMCSA